MSEDSEKDKIHLLPNANVSGVTVKLLKQMAADIAEQNQFVAEMRFARYQAHIKAGFTESEALKLCVNLTLAGQ